MPKFQVTTQRVTEYYHEVETEGIEEAEKLVLGGYIAPYNHILVDEKLGVSKRVKSKIPLSRPS